MNVFAQCIKIRSDDSKCHVVVGESGCDLSKRNHAKMAFLSEWLKKTQVVVRDDGDEYKSLCDEFGVERIDDDINGK